MDSVGFTGVYWFRAIYGSLFFLLPSPPVPMTIGKRLGPVPRLIGGRGAGDEGPQAVDAPPYRENEAVRYPAPEVNAVQGRPYLSHLPLLSALNFLLLTFYALIVFLVLICLPPTGYSLFPYYTSVYHIFVK